MKILAIGDFHGKLPEKLEKVARRKDIDFIISSGDFANADKIRKIIFKNWANKKWHEAIGVAKAARLEKESYNSGLRIMKELNKLKKNFYFVWGNSDFYREFVTGEPEEIMPGHYDDALGKLRNLNLIDRRKVKIKGVEILGHGGYVDVTEFVRSSVDKDRKTYLRRVKRYKKQEREMNKMFRKKKPKNFIFVTHYTPYKILDRVNFKGSPMHGKKVGWEPYNRVIKKYSPFLVICGHMHENQGMQKLGSSLVVNPGSAKEGKAAIIEIEGKRVLNVKFLR